MNFDIKTINKWTPPEASENAVKILSMPNVPKPLHTLAPRIIFGQSTWDRMRKRCYYSAGYKCEVCGCEPEKGKLDAHEVYLVDYDKCTSIFVRTIALCRKCHTEPGVHTGRAYTMYRNGNVLMPKQKLLEGVEHIFKLVNDYNQNRSKGKEELRLFATYVQYWKDKTLREDMGRLINQYDIKFYNVPPTETERWGDWKLIIGNKEYPTKFKTVDDWENAMALNVKPGRIKTEEEKEVNDLWDVL